MPKIISPVGFKQLLQSSQHVLPVDATWYLPNAGKSGFAEFKKQRIPNAVFLDIDKVKDVKSKYPHMMPGRNEFSRQVGALGIQNRDLLVFYDQIGNFSAPRAAWMFDVFRHKKVFLLDNFAKYVAEGGRVDTATVETATYLAPSEYVAGKAQDQVMSFEEVYGIVTDAAQASKYHILDARSAARFSGAAPEPRAGLPSGHTPFAVSTPASGVLGADKQFLSRDQLLEFFSERQVDNSKPVIVMCGTGVTACIVKSALDLSGLGQAGVKIYDGSWTEYAQRADKKYIVKS